MYENIGDSKFNLQITPQAKDCYKPLVDGV